MSDLPVPVEVDEEEAGDSKRPLRRDRDISGTSRSKIRDRLTKLFDDIARGFEDQKDRADDQSRFWDCYDCIINECQYYHGIAEIYFPIIHDAIDARATRFVNQMFPQGGRSIEEVSADGAQHGALVGLLEHYLREAQFETNVMKPLCRNGDIEGQFNLYVDWATFKRELTSRHKHGPTVDMGGGASVELPGEEIEDIITEEVEMGRPVFEVLHDSDVLVLPANVDSLDECFAVGGSASVARRWTKAKIDEMASSGEIRGDAARTLKDEMGKVYEGEANAEKKLIEHVGIEAKGKQATVWETWTMLPLDDKGNFSESGTPRLCRVYFGPGKAVLGVKRNPYWNDRCPLLSAPVEKVAGVFKGKSKIAHVASLQYEANDAVNEGADAATLSAAPIIRRDTEKSNGPLVLANGAVWDAPAGAVEIMAFPDLTPRAVVRVQAAVQAIFQSLGVNPSMLPQQAAGARPSQARVAQEQQIDLLTTAEGVKVLTQGIATPCLGLMVDFDYQFRNKPVTVRAFGMMGRKAVMQAVEPLVNRAAFTFQWRGAEQVKLMAMMQQQGIGFFNVMRPIAPMLDAEGFGVKFAPLAEAMAQSIFGAWLGSQIIVDKRQEEALSQDQENEWLERGSQVPVNPLDNDAEHLKKLLPWMQMTGDPHGTGRAHAELHMKQMQTKAMVAQAKMAQQSGAIAGPGGQPGAPQPGASPAQPHAVKRPPGAVHPDRAAASGIIQPPRRVM